MTFDALIAYGFAYSLGGSPNSYAAKHLTQKLDDLIKDGNTDDLSDKLYLYLLLYISPKQKEYREKIKKLKDISEISDDDMIDVFTDIMNTHSSYSYYDNKAITEYLLLFKEEIDKRPNVAACLVLGGYENVVKNQKDIKEDMDYKRFINNRSNYPTKTYIKFLSDENEEYFTVGNMWNSNSCQSVSLADSRNINVIKNYYHLYLMYCLSAEDIEENRVKQILLKDIKSKKFDIDKAKTFISHFLPKILPREYKILDSLYGSTRNDLGLMNVNRRNYYWNDPAQVAPLRDNERVAISMRVYTWNAYVTLFTFKYLYIVSELLSIFGKDIVDDVKKAMEVLGKSFFICSSVDEWKQKNLNEYTKLANASTLMSKYAPQSVWPFSTSQDKVVDWNLKVEFNEPLDDSRYYYEYNHITILREQNIIDSVERTYKSIESNIKTIENN